MSTILIGDNGGFCDAEIYINMKIEAYIYVNNERPYIIMSEETTRTIAGLIKARGVTIKQYNGCKVLIDNDLKYGQIEIR